MLSIRQSLLLSAPFVVATFARCCCRFCRCCCLLPPFDCCFCGRCCRRRLNFLGIIPLALAVAVTTDCFVADMVSVITACCCFVATFASCCCSFSVATGYFCCFVAASWLFPFRYYSFVVTVTADCFIADTAVTASFSAACLLFCHFYQLSMLFLSLPVAVVVFCLRLNVVIVAAVVTPVDCFLLDIIQYVVLCSLSPFTAHFVQIALTASIKVGWYFFFCNRLVIATFVSHYLIVSVFPTASGCFLRSWLVVAAVVATG